MRAGHYNSLSPEQAFIVRQMTHWAETGLRNEENWDKVGVNRT